jgi:hypothetical protein
MHEMNAVSTFARQLNYKSIFRNRHEIAIRSHADYYYRVAVLVTIRNLNKRKLPALIKAGILFALHQSPPLHLITILHEVRILTFYLCSAP